jgi:hypothetical protein
MKKFFLPLALLLLTTAVFAETEMRMRSLDERVSKLENKTGSTCSHDDLITPNATPKVQRGMDMFITTGLLYWSARLDTLSYAQSGIGNLSTNQNPSQGKEYSVDWGWDPGFKAGYGWSLAHGGWDLYLQYTWFYSNVSSRNNQSDLLPTFDIISPISQTPDDFVPLSMSGAHARWNLHYQMLDLELGRNYYINRYLKLRPFIGLKGTWQKQAYHVSFNTIPILINSVSTPFDFKMNQHQMLWGIGPRTGLNTSWQFSKHFSLYGDFALTGLWTHYNISRKDRFEEINIPDDQISTANLKETLHVIKPALELGIGFRLERYFHSNRFHMLFQAGWETQIWPNQTLYINLNHSKSRYDLSLQGFTTKFRFDF